MEIEVPSYILGKEIYNGKNFSEVYFDYGKENLYQSYWAKKLFGKDSISIKVVRLIPNEKYIKNLCKKLIKNQKKIKNKSVHEISEIIRKVGEEIKEDTEFKKIEKLLSVLYGRSPEVVRLETKMLIDGMISNNEIINSQVGGINKLEERDPIGLIYDILSGNTAIIPIQIIYSKLCRNSDFIKTASGDPITAVEIAKRLGNEDKHIGKSLVVTYFPGNLKNMHELLISEADKVVVYGGEESVKTVSKLSEKYRKYFVDHGPRRALIYCENPKNIGEKIIQDVIPFEQIACVSPYLIFVKESILEKVGKQILNASIKYSKLYPPTPNWQEVHRKEKYWKELGATIYTNKALLKEKKDNYFRVALLPENLNIEKVENELLADSTYRFVFLKPVKDENEVIDYLNKTKLRDYISRVGTDNNVLKNYVSENMSKACVCKIGKLCYIAPNEKHDGYYDLLELIKSVE